MTVMEFFGCSFLAFGPPLAMFAITIAKDPIRIIIMIASAFFWLVSLLLSSILWFVVIPLRTVLVFGLVFSVFFQELFRLLFYMLLRKAEFGLRRVSEEETHVTNNRQVLAYVSGLGFGLMSGAFSLVDVLADATGPGTMDLYDGSEYFLVISAATTLCFILLHTFWGVIFFSALDHKVIWQVVFVVAAHLVTSCITLLNQNQHYVLTLVGIYLILIVTTIITFKVAGGSLNSLKRGLMWRPATTINVTAN
ncbi:gamma-secretase subunit Aph-1 [Neocloeon triangulifer]|uniref:gamma-secretase subunit Aph-1 n=1 Tax=Neocloeon triangulifer TaxID=2078957 RepID=UPI00286F3423|nr:gamma-secretase subunit Aph-1 [Neocloeon triangulifer]XP_059472310.1 gamma-secretase subunit Aph-1 [Neocloeon triangulifer]